MHFLCGALDSSQLEAAPAFFFLQRDKQTEQINVWLLKWCARNLLLNTGGTRLWSTLTGNKLPLSFYYQIMGSHVPANCWGLLHVHHSGQAEAVAPRRCVNVGCDSKTTSLSGSRKCLSADLSSLFGNWKLSPYSWVVHPIRIIDTKQVLAIIYGQAALYCKCWHCSYLAVGAFTILIMEQAPSIIRIWGC